MELQCPTENAFMLSNCVTKLSDEYNYDSIASSFQLIHKAMS